MMSMFNDRGIYDHDSCDHDACGHDTYGHDIYDDTHGSIHRLYIGMC